MQRITRALAVGVPVVLSLPVAAQTVQIYGRLYPEVVFTRMTGATAPGTPLSTLAQPPTGESFSNIVKMDFAATSRSAMA